MICKATSLTAMVTALINRSRVSVLLLALAAFLFIIPSRAVCAEMQTIVVVKSADLKPYQDVLRGLRNGCGCDVQEVKVKNEEDKERILDSHPRAIVAIGTAAFKKVMTIRDIPVIYTMVIPSETARPLPSNISGVSMDISPATYLATMKELFPTAKRIGLIFDPRNTGEFVGNAMKAAQSAGMELVTKRVDDPSQVPTVIKAMQRQIDVFWLIPDPTVVTKESVDYLFQISFENNVPIFTFSKKYVEQGAVASLDIDPYDMGEQVASIVARALAGQSVGSPIYARKSYLTINKKIARKLGLTIGEGARSKVDENE
jgi:putative ABC transport system substrate-binding protein